MINVVVDLETLPDQHEGAEERISKTLSPPANYKKAETIDKWWIEQAPGVVDQIYRDTSLNGLYGEICSIAWAIEDQPVRGLVRAQGETERGLLAQFWIELEKGVEAIESKYIHSPHVGKQEGFVRQYPAIRWIGHNVAFDLRFLKQRSLINNMRPSYNIPADARHGGDRVFCTQKEWCGIYPPISDKKEKRFVSLKALCEAFGIEDEDTMDGSEVYDAWLAGETDRILTHAKIDVDKTRQIYRRMTWQA